MLYIFISSRRADVTPDLTCNGATYRFRDIRCQKSGFWGSLGCSQKGSRPVHIYHHAKFHVHRLHLRGDIRPWTKKKFKKHHQIKTIELRYSPYGR